ncbi:helix-turn-helix domain-containing protein [Nocardia cerradoensis]|uniref:helix-turn-helix domain-containing protein n=1 Tax=Nocardia cerradoensis TaxID=85688 RepID=UPI001675C0B4|nr:helix-turn-helix domain-containing protein [Nocardia cerradoensis]
MNLLGVVEVAEMLGIGRRAVVDLIRTHQLTAKKLPGRTGAYVLTPEDVEAYRKVRDEKAAS